MLTKGIIQSIDYLDNTCVVRIPVFETAGSKEQMTATSTMTALPGVYGGYKVNDVVIVGFENEQYGEPIILGKLFLGNVEESAKEGGAINCTNLTVSTAATLPVNTELTYDIPEDSVKNTEASLTTFHSIKEIAAAVTNNSKQIKNNVAKGGITVSTSEQIAGSWIDGSLLYQRTYFFSKGTTRILLSDINFNTIWVDVGQSFYLDTVSTNSGKISNPLLASINIAETAIDVPSLTSDDGYGYVTIKYTKK